MAIDKNKLASIISGNAKALCSPQGDRMISEITNQRVNNPNGVQSRNYMDYNDDFITESYNDRGDKVSRCRFSSAAMMPSSGFAIPIASS